MTDPSPFVRAVVVNFDGGPMTMECLHRLAATDWPADRLEILLVDNGSHDGVAHQVRQELPALRVIRQDSNTGFAAGCNLGIRAPGGFHHVALVNNDVRVEPGWLRPLMTALEQPGKIGAACPKILLDDRYLEAVLEVPDASSIGNDERTLGVELIGARIDGAPGDQRLAFDEGWFDPVDGSIRRWSWRRGAVRVQLGDSQHPTSLELLLRSPVHRHAVVRTPNDEVAILVDQAPRWVQVDLGTEPIDVVNNAGSALYPRGFGGDRGFLERDDGQYDERVEVFAWCGALALLDGRFLADVGMLDEDLFLYYEDFDLSWRGRLRGWQYVYEPRSVVRHRHAATSSAGSPTFRYYNERNRLLVLAKHAPARVAWRAMLGQAARTIRTTPRNSQEAAHRRRVLAGATRLLPRALRARWRRGRTVTRRALMEWTTFKDTAG